MASQILDARTWTQKENGRMEKEKGRGRGRRKGMESRK